MIESVQFKNFKVFRDTTLPLGRFTLMIGPNGSGKSAALHALQSIRKPAALNFHKIVTAHVPIVEGTTVEIVLRWGPPYAEVTTTASWSPTYESVTHDFSHIPSRTHDFEWSLQSKLDAIRIYSLNAVALAAPVQLVPHMELEQNGIGLAGVLDRLRDHEPERFEALNEEFGQWMPEFDRILFDVPNQGTKAFLLRKRDGHHKIPADELSQGTLLALAILTLSYLPDPPFIICLEEPDRGLHPRLFRRVQDALYRLSYPEDHGEKRGPVQVIATTHSPYLLDLYKDHPEEIVIANQVGQEVQFGRLSDQPHIQEILDGAPLGEIWYTGVLGGGPA